MLNWYEACRNLVAPAVRNQQWFLVGPWVHGGTGAAYVGSAQQGELSYPDAAFKSDSMAIDFFAHFLLNQANGFEQTPLVWCYDLGKQGWVNPSVPLAQPLNTNLLFQANGQLGMAFSQGFSTWISNPKTPTPTLGGQTLAPGLTQGPLNQISLQQRSDLLWFETNPLTQDFTCMGRPSVRVYVSSSQPDADIVVRLVDVYPDGRQMLIHDGIRRLRFRNGYTINDESFLSPTEVAEMAIELPFIRYTWKPGHRVGVYIAGNSASRWDVNLQNGGPMYVAGDTLASQMTFFHSAQYPSSLQLPGNGLVLTNTPVEMSNLNIFPNPASVYLTIPGLKPGTSVTVYDALGKSCGTYFINHTHQIHPKNLPAGTYWIQSDVGRHAFQWCP